MIFTWILLLSFDDGVSKYTPEIVDLVIESQVESNFYIKWENIEGNEETLLRMHDNGLGVCNHTWTHPDLTELSSLWIFNELWSTSMHLFMVTWEMPDCFRPPYWKVDDRVIDIADRLWMRVDWSLKDWVFDSMDWHYKDLDKQKEYLINNYWWESEILMHDIFENSLDYVKFLLWASTQK